MPRNESEVRRGRFDLQGSVSRSCKNYVVVSGSGLHRPGGRGILPTMKEYPLGIALD